MNFGPKILTFLNRYRLILLLIVELIIASNVKWGQDQWKRVIAFDGKGYYAYLPAIFIYDDLHFGFHDRIEKEYSSARNYFDFRQHSGNGIVNKCFVGTSIAEFPFFMVAHAFTKMSGGITDGYSFYYQIAISLAAIVYCFLGMYFLTKLLRLYNVSENVITVVVFSFAFSTSLFNYTLFEPSMSHVFSFAFSTLFLYKLKAFCNNPEKSHFIQLSVIYALIILIRPVNGIVLICIPFIAGSAEKIKMIFRFIRSQIPTTILAILIFLGIISIQPILYYLQSGSFYAYAYGNEKLILNRPEILNILFSYRKGLFVYAPILFISMFGLIILYRQTGLRFSVSCYSSLQ